MKIARFDENYNIQTVEGHLLNVSSYCKKIAVKIGLEKTAYLIGIMHDMGKLSDEFQNYIKSQMNKKESKSKVDHGVYGAKYILKFDQIGRASCRERV